MRNGDVGHQLVISYCRRQAEYESEDEKVLDQILATINQTHRAVVQEISAARKQPKATREQLTLSKLASRIWVWAHQNRELAAMLEHQKPLAFLSVGLNQILGNNIEQEVRKKVMYVIEKSWSTLQTSPTADWPLTVKIRDTSKTESDGGTIKRKYTVAVEFWPNLVRSDLLPKLKDALRELFPKEVDKYATANVRRFGRKSNVPEERLQREVEELHRRLHGKLQALVQGIE